MSGAPEPAGGDAPENAPPGAPAVVPGARHRVEIVRRDGRGRGVAALGRRELRVPNALPGEVVDVRLAHVGRHVATARLEGVVRASPERVADECPHGAVCPGCGLRTASPRDRLAFKRERLATAFAEAGLDPAVVEACVPAPAEDGSRWKAFLTPRAVRAGLQLGLFEERSHRLVDVPGCPAHAPPVERAAVAVRAAILDVRPSLYDERRGAGWLRHVAIRASSTTGEAVVTLVVAAAGESAAMRLAHAIRKRARHVVGVVENVHEQAGNAPFGPHFRTVEGRGEIEEAAAGLPLRVSAGSFFQVNPPAAAAIQDRLVARAADAPAGPVLDLYGGVGVTAVRLATAGHEVVLVEAAGSAVRDAEENARRHAQGRVRVVAERVETGIAGHLASRPSIGIVNPPRGGLSEAVRRAILAAPPPVLFYVSCDPGSLARDASALSAAYAVERVTPFDLMPQTPHVEALAVFVRPT